jgi:hypothetical protein
MLTKIALAAALIAGTASLALAEDGSSSFANNIYSPYGVTATQQRSAPAFTSRNVGLGNGQVVNGAQGGSDHASSPYAGGGF